MFDHTHYVPILKAKMGEFSALADTANPTKDGMTPLFEIVNIPFDYQEESEAKTIEAHLTGLDQKIAACWGDKRRFFVDSNVIDPSRTMSDGVTHHLTFLFDSLRAADLQGVPVTGLDRPTAYQAAVSGIAAADGRGICLRLNSANLVDPDIVTAVDAALGFHAVGPAETDLVLDFGAIHNMNPAIILSSSLSALTTTVPHVNNWRSLTVAASGFPVNLSDIDGNTIDTIDRLEWAIWQQLLTRPLPRKPTFGDYSIAHPEITEMDPRIMTVSASIRYTSDDYWLIVRGRSTKKHGWSQYHNLAANLIARAEYAGPGFSWGDAYINECASASAGPGNATTWRRVGNNHHFQKVVTQIASLP